MSVNAGAINIDPAPNTASAKSELSTNINVGDEIYAENTTLNLNAGSEVDRKAYADTYTIGIGVASGRDRGKTSSKDAVSISVGSNPSAVDSFNGLANLNISAVNNPDSNLKALGAAGGILNIASQSYAENSSDNSASTSVNGSWNLTGDLTMLASVDESVRETARQGSGEIAGGSGVYVDNTIKGNSSAVVGTDAVINASNVDISAKNVIDTNGFDGDKYALVDYFGGGIVIDGLTSTLTYDRDAGVKIQGSVNTTGDQTYTARSDGTVRNKIIAEGGSIGGSTIARSFSTVDYDDTIKFTGAVHSAGALNAIANDAIAVDTSAVTKVGGGVEVLIGKTENTINRTNLIKVDGTVGSTNDLTFNAGGTKDDLFSDQIQTKIDTLVETSNYSVVPISVNNAIAKINSNSQIDISSSGKVNGGSDVYLTANGGALSTFTTQYQWAWVDGGGTTSKQRLDSTGDNLLGTDHNFVNVDGVLTAGASNPDINPDIVISIDGQAVPAGYSTSAAVSPLTISCSTDAVDISTGTVDYANELSNRLSLINSLITDYTMGALSNEALSGYLLERQRILDKLDELGLLEYATESAGKP